MEELSRAAEPPAASKKSPAPAVEAEASRRTAASLLLLPLLFVVIAFLELPGSWLLEPGEARYAEIPREMLETGDWVTPRVNRQPYFEKPPLFYWANALFLQVFGENAYAARVTSRLSALGVAVMLLLALSQGAARAQDVGAGLGGSGDRKPSTGDRPPAVGSAGSAGANVPRRAQGARGTAGSPAEPRGDRQILARRNQRGPNDPGEAGVTPAPGGRKGHPYETAVNATEIPQGPLAALIYLSSVLPFLLARQNLIDGLLTAAMTASLLSLREFARRRERGESGRGWIAAAAAAAAVGTLAKGLVGLVLPGLVFLVWALLTRRARLLRETLLSPGPVIFLAIALPWFVAMERANEGFLHFFFVREHLQRFTGGAKRSQSLFYFVPVLVAGFLPWVFFLPRAARDLRPFSLARLRERSDSGFFLIWAVVVFLFFTFSRSKLIPYILPMFPALAVLTARGLASAGAAGLRRARAASAAAALLFLAVVLAQPRATRDFTAHPFVEAYRRYRSADARLVTYHTYLHGLAWELKEPVVMASWVGELRPAYERDMHHPLFWQEPTFWHRWNGGEKLVALTRARDRDEFRLRSAVPFTHLLTVRDHVLLANFALR